MRYGLLCPECKTKTVAHCESPRCPWWKCATCKLVGGRLLRVVNPDGSRQDPMRLWRRYEEATPA